MKIKEIDRAIKEAKENKKKYKLDEYYSGYFQGSIDTLNRIKKNIKEKREV